MRGGAGPEVFKAGDRHRRILVGSDPAPIRIHAHYDWGVISATSPSTDMQEYIKGTILPLALSQLSRSIKVQHRHAASVRGAVCTAVGKGRGEVIAGPHPGGHAAPTCLCLCSMQACRGVGESWGTGGLCLC